MLKNLKKIYKESPGIVKKPLVYVPFSVFLGKDYRAMMSDLSASHQFDLLEVRSRALSVVEYASKHVGFYKDYFNSRKIKKISWDDFLELPVITKEQISSDYSWFVSDEYSTLNSYVVTTGGTTGKQSRICLSNMSFKIEWAFVNSYLKSRGVQPDSRRLCLRGVDFGRFNKGRLTNLNPLYKELQISPFLLSEESLGHEADCIANFGASWIHGYPSTVTEFCKLSKVSGLNSRLDISNILLVSEKIYPDQMAVITDAFPSAKIITFYGLSERIIFAEEKSGVFYPNHSYGYTEELNGELIGTGFINRAMPLIRYATGDEVRVTKQDGLVVSIDELVGRWGKEYLLSRSGARYGMTSLNTHMDVFDTLKGYQFYQREAGSCTLRLLPLDNAELTSEVVAQIVRAFQEKVGDELKIHPEVVAKLHRTVRGKHQFIVSELC